MNKTPGLLCCLLLTACGGESSSDSTTTTTSNTTTGTTPSPADFVGYWSGSANVTDIDGSHVSTIESFVSESGFTVVVADDGDSVLFGDMSYIGIAGTGTLTEFDGGEISYTASASLTNDSLTFSVKSADVSANATLTADATNNAELKKNRTVYDLDGTWFEYESTSPNVITLSNGSVNFQSVDGGCYARLRLSSGSETYSEFKATMLLSDCDDSDFDGTYKGIAISNQDESIEAFTLFVYNDRAWIGTDFKRQ